MSTRIEDRPVTADELLRMHDKGFRRELVRGVVRERPLVVVADPWNRRVTVYDSRDDIRVLCEGDVVDGGDVVPGWKLPVKGLFS